MKAAYLVTENALNAELLKRLLPAEIVQNTGFVAGKGQYSARSLAGTVLSERMRPVALVIDAETDNASLIRERKETIISLLRPASSGIPYEVFLVVPTLASMLSQEIANDEPLQAEVINSLRPERVEFLSQQPLLKQITEFLTAALKQAA